MELVNYYLVLIGWCLINLPITFIGWNLEMNMFHVSLFFFLGVFVILAFMMVEAIKEDKERNRMLEELK